MPKSLLLADDSTTIRTAVGMVFKKEDFALTTVANGTEALERARDLKPDLILADVDMPGLSGYELCEKVRADATLKQTFASGDIFAIYDKWFTKPIPPRGIVLNFPQSAQWKKIVASPTDSGDPKDYR